MKKLLLLVIMLWGVSGAMGQQVYNSSGKTHYNKKKKQGYDPDKLVLGGGVNLGLGNGYFSIGASPFVGYRVAKPLSVGIGAGYLYQRQASTVDQYNKIYYDKGNMVYPNLWARCFFYRNYYVVAAYEYDIISLNVAVPDLVTSQIGYKRVNVTNMSAPVGLGAKQTLGGRASIYLELVYDIFQGTYSPYPKAAPTTRLGIAFGL